jgi:hypothetical protein
VVNKEDLVMEVKTEVDPDIRVETLSEDQLAGFTCIRCGRVPVNAELIGRHGRGHLLICADQDLVLCNRKVYWLDRPCPAWCDGSHADQDHPDDRAHMSAWEGMVPMLREKAHSFRDVVRGPFQPEYAVVRLRQDLMDREPTIWCGVGESATGIRLAPAEARALAMALTHAADLADGVVEPTEQSRASLPPVS